MLRNHLGNPHEAVTVITAAVRRKSTLEASGVFVQFKRFYNVNFSEGSVCELISSRNRDVSNRSFKLVRKLALGLHNHI